MEKKTVPCKWCGKPIKIIEDIFLSPRMCDDCWELSTRINNDPILARRMLREFTITFEGRATFCSHCGMIITKEEDKEDGI